MDDINPKLCSHLLYAFVKIDNNLDIYPTEPNDLKGNYKAFNDLKIGYDTVTMLSVGGQRGAAAGFELASASEENRKKFARNLIEYVRKYGFDGIDIDWEYPKKEEKHRFTLLLKVSTSLTFYFHSIHCLVATFVPFDSISVKRFAIFGYVQVCGNYITWPKQFKLW